VRKQKKILEIGGRFIRREVERGENKSGGHGTSSGSSTKNGKISISPPRGEKQEEYLCSSTKRKKNGKG